VLLLIDQPVTTFSTIWLPGEGTKNVGHLIFDNISVYIGRCRQF